MTPPVAQPSIVGPHPPRCSAMHEIHLSRGYSAVVDEADFDRVRAFKWHAHITTAGAVYAARWVTVRPKTRRLVRLHHFLLGVDPVEPVDHANGDSLDNRRGNLRQCSQAENNRNRGPNTGRRFKGPSFKPSRGHWESVIKHCGKRRFLGSFKSEEEAALAYDVAATALFGPFARLNFPAGVE